MDSPAPASFPIAQALAAVLCRKPTAWWFPPVAATPGTWREHAPHCIVQKWAQNVGGTQEGVGGAGGDKLLIPNGLLAFPAARGWSYHAGSWQAVC